jgi:hypothetical protein
MAAIGVGCVLCLRIRDTTGKKKKNAMKVFNCQHWGGFVVEEAQSRVIQGGKKHDEVMSWRRNSHGPNSGGLHMQCCLSQGRSRLKRQKMAKQSQVFKGVFLGRRRGWRMRPQETNKNAQSDAIDGVCCCGGAGNGAYDISFG